MRKVRKREGSKDQRSHKLHWRRKELGLDEGREAAAFLGWKSFKEAFVAAKL